MKITKKIFSIILCGAVSVLAPVSSAAAAGEISDPLTGIDDALKTARFGIHTYYVENLRETGETGGKYSIYDLYTKYDTEGFNYSTNPDELSHIATPSGGYVEKIECQLWLDETRFVAPLIDDYTNTQYNHTKLRFFMNGDYTVVATASSGAKARVTINVDRVITNNSSDDQAPKVKVTMPKAGTFPPNDPVQIAIEADELCDFEIDGRSYKECSGFLYSIATNGTYQVKAKDKNGNTSYYDFNVDIIGNTASQQTTTAPATTTKPKTTTTTAVTTTPVTTAKPNSGGSRMMGDVDGDGRVDASDATVVLVEYSKLSTGSDYTLSAEQRKAADVNKDGKIDANDASKILEYYAAISTGKTPTWK